MAGVNYTVSASMFKKEKDFLRAKYEFKGKGEGKTETEALVLKHKYFKEAKVSWTEATASLRDKRKSLGIFASGGDEVTGDKSIEMDYSYLKGEEWMVAYSSSGIDDSENPEGEFTLVGKNNGWNFS